MDRDERHAKRYRLRNQREFERVYHRRRSVADDVLVLYGCENDLAQPRLGLAVGRKVGGAVVRNRWKRLIRDAFRRARCDLPPGIDLVVVPRPRAEPTLATVAASLDRLATRLARKLARDSR